MTNTAASEMMEQSFFDIVLHTDQIYLIQWKIS